MTSTFSASNIAVANGQSKRLAAGRCNGESILGVTVKADQALNVSVAWGRLSDTPAAAGATTGSLPWLVSAQSFVADAASVEGGTRYSFSLPPMAEIYQIVLSNASGAGATVSRVDWALQDYVVKEIRC